MLWNDNIRTGTLDFDGGFCEDNGGRIGKETVESKKVLKCELPTRVIPKTEIDQKRQESGISAGVSGFKQTCKAAGYNPSFRDLAMSGEDRDDLANWSCNAYD